MNNSKEKNEQNHFVNKEKKAWQKPVISKLAISQTAQNDDEPLYPPQRAS